MIDLPFPSPKNDDELYQRGLIITDNKAPLPILDFDSYKEAIVKIIKGSYPNFTIGIYGEWGTGKTTLMSIIKEKLREDKENIVTVWFDAWRYENEKEFTLMPMLKTINYAIDARDEDKQKLKEALKEAAIFTVGVSRDIVSSTVTNYFGENLGGPFKKSLEDVTTRLIPKLRRLSEIDKNAIFFEGIGRIQEEIDKIRANNNNFRIVVFVDDLDRCSEQKILEVLESIKVFLALNGFIYVLGVSHDKVAELITRKYGTDGEQYLKKFIQIPVTLSEWNESDIKLLVEHFLLNDIIHEDYKSIVKDNIEIITKALEENPRETKRFLNNLFISYEVFVKIKDLKEEDEKKLFLKELLLIQIINSSWRDLYRQIITSKGKVLEKLIPYVPLNINKVRENLESKSETQIDPQVKVVFEKYKSNSKLWDFLSKDNLDVLRGVSDWNIFRRAVKLTAEIPFAIKEWNQKALKLLITGNIAEFNEKRVKYFADLNLEGDNLRGANLSGANLSGASLVETKLEEANLEEANLEEANLEEASFVKANLRVANLTGANLKGANLGHAHLMWANFSRAMLVAANLEGASLTGANLSGANLTGANLSRTMLVAANLEGATLTGANLSGATLNGDNLRGANLSGANLSGAGLIETNFEGACLMETNLERANLEGARLSNSFIINPKNYQSLIINEKTGFDDAIIDDSDFIEYLSKFTKIVPKKIENKNKLKLKLEETELPTDLVKELLGKSKLS